MLKQKAAGEVLAIYDASSFTPRQGEGNEPADHITHELDYVVFCMDNGIDYKDFVQKHLQRWVPAFCDEVLARAESDFFKETANKTKEAIQKIA
jgi:TorA maturation chaperone TorD